MANRLELKKVNKNIVYRSLKDEASYTALDISHETGISIPTVTQNLKELVKDGLVEIGETKASTGGRRALSYIKISDAKYAIGIDITQNHLTVAVLNLAAKIVCISKRESFHFTNTDACYDKISLKVFSLLSTNHINNEKILGVGVSLPSIVDREKKEVIYSKIIDAPRMIIEELRKRFPFHVEIFNDANAAGYAESNMFNANNSDAKENDITVYIMLSNSVGGAIVDRGQIYLGTGSKSGEIGHMRIVPNGKECFCGQKGCMNAYCSAKVLSEHTGGNLENFFDNMERGNRELEAVFDEYLDYLAISVINLRMIFDGTIVLGGYVGALLDKYKDKLQDKIKALDPYKDDNDYVKICHYKTEASAVGAALLFIVNYVEQV